MRHSAPLRTLLLVGLPLAALLVLLGSTPRAFGDDPMPPGMGGDPQPGMDSEPGMDAGMGGGAAPGMDGGDAKSDPDAEDDVPDALSIRVKKAVDAGVAWLMKKQGGGAWPALDWSGSGSYGGQKGGSPYPHAAGPNGLALYTLLKCQVPATNNVIKAGFDWLDKHYRRPGGTYETAMVLLAICATADPSKKTDVSEANRNLIREKLTGPMRKWAQEMVDSLLKKHESNNGRKGWRYQITQGTAKSTEAEPNGSEDMSCTQLVALSLFAADRCGVTVPTALWKDILGFSLTQQEDSGPDVVRTAHLPEAKAGKRDPKAPPLPVSTEKFIDHARGFSYMKTSPDPNESRVYNSVSACGLAGLMLPRFVLQMRKDTTWKKGGLDAKVQQSVYDAIAWLEKNWSPSENTLHDGWHGMYYMYCVERAMDMVGNKLVGKHIWYLEGAERLVDTQNKAGFWDTKKTYKPCDLIDTCFALLFLRRSTKGAIPFPDVTGGSDEPPVDNRGKQDDPSGN